jgi:glycosyltransferase involved in cell wall biosynthesis
MRIRYLCADPGIPLDGRKGAAAHVRGLVRAFRAAGHEVDALAACPGDAARLGVPVAALPAPSLADALAGGTPERLRRALRHLWNNAAVERALSELHADRPADLVYERYAPFGVAGGIAARALGVPHLLEVNAPLAREGAQYRAQALADVAAVLERSAFAATRLVLAVSEELRDELVAGGVEPERIAVVANGVDTDAFAPEGPSRRAAFGERFVVGFVGGLRPWHAIDALAEAFRKLAPDPRFHLLVVGDGPLAGVLEALERELPQRVTWVRGADHDEVPAWVRAMDVALAPCPPLERFYFSPLKVFEYLAAGRPVVASAIGQLERLVADGETGLLVPPGDAGALADAVRRLAADAPLRARLGAAAAALARREHTWRHRVERILALAAGCA